MSRCQPPSLDFRRKGIDGPDFRTLRYRRCILLAINPLDQLLISLPFEINYPLAFRAVATA